MRYIKRWIIKLIVDDIRHGGEIGKAIKGESSIVSVDIGGPLVQESQFEDAVMKAISSAQRKGRSVA